MMRSLPFLLIAGFVLVMLAAGEADAEKEPEWFYDTGDQVYSVAISADGEYIVAGGNDDKVHLFDKDNSTPLWSYDTGFYSVHEVAISADGEYIATGPNKVRLFDKDNSTPLYETGDNVYSVAISADGEYIVAGGGGFDEKVYLFDKDSSTPLWSYKTEGWVYSVAISADGKYIAAGSWDDNVYLFDKDSSTPLWSYDIGEEVYAVDISADGEYIVAGGSDVIYLFNKDSSTPLWSYDAGKNVAISADGEYIVAGGNDHKVHLFDKDSNTSLWNYDTGSSVDAVAISADGEYIVAGSQHVRLFDKDSSTPLWSYDTGSSVYSVAVSADGEYIAAGSYGGKVYFFDKSIPPNIAPTAHIDSISPSPARFGAEVTFSGTGSDSDGTVVAYEWISSRDGLLSDEEDFSITGLNIGYHSITFRVQDNDGNWSSYSSGNTSGNTTAAELYVYTNAPPVGTIDSIEPSPAEEGTAVSFSATGSDSDGTIVAYHWESSIDGELSTEEDFSSSGLSLGHHTITFQVQDNDGVWNSPQGSGENGSVPGISLWIYAVPVAIAGDDVSTTPTVPVQFNGQGIDEDGTIAKYEWDFDGNGIYDWSSTENGRELNIYNNEGTYTAVLRVTDNDGFTNTDMVVITVTEKKIQIDDKGNVTVTDTEEDEEGIPALSVITSMAAVAVIALRRRY